MDGALVVESLWNGGAQVEEGKMEAVLWADLEKPHKVSNYLTSFIFLKIVIHVNQH